MDYAGAALTSAKHALSQLELPAMLPRLHAAGISIKHTILGGSHSVVTYPPLNALQQIDAPSLVVRDAHFGRQINLYVHIAFCETMCTFCHYTVEHYRGTGHSTPSKIDRVGRYLTCLKDEMRFWGRRLRKFGTQINSVYIGGGTPLVLETEELYTLLLAVRDEFDVLPGAAWCVEGSPLTICAPDGDEKLQALTEAGVTRLSFGVQSFDDKVLRYAARGYRRDTAIRACEIAARRFDNWNLDLIQGLYCGTTREIWENLLAIATLRPAHLTWYHGRFAQRPQGDWYTIPTKRQHFADEEDTLLGRMLIWQQMRALGYRQTDGNRFVRSERYTDPFKQNRTSVKNDLLGIGASAYSHVDTRYVQRCDQHLYVPTGVFFRNHVDIQKYMEVLESSHLPLANAWPFSDEDWIAASYVVGLRTKRGRDEYTEWLEELRPETARHYQTIEHKLRRLGLTTANRSGIKLTPRGRLFEDEVLSQFYGREVQRALAA